LPRKPVEKVVEHRITLGQKEREMFETLTTAYTVNKVGTPLVSLISDPVALGALGLAALALFPSLTEGLPNNWEELTEEMNQSEIAQFLKDNTSGGAAVGGGLGALIGLFFGMPFVGAAVGSVAGETTENYLLEEQPELVSVQISILSWLLSQKRKIV
tara:strand:- start:135 stop:608 length:474 start_codon:yes stop_codon:yes gene_type:complete